MKEKRIYQEVLDKVTGSNYNKEEILKRLEEIEDLMFSLDMIDRWDDEIRQTYNDLWKEQQTLKEKLKEI